MMGQYFVYMLASKKNGTIYIGVTNNLLKRVFEHKNNLVAGFTQKYNVHSLVYYEVYQNIFDAITREKRMKKWKRQWKIRLIEESNPNWEDLYDNLSV
jgi:putative endonuclease